MANYVFPPTKAKINALAFRIKQMKLPSTCEAIMLSSLRALYSCQPAIMNMDTISHLQQAYYSILDHYKIDESSLLDDVVKKNK